MWAVLALTALLCLLAALALQRAPSVPTATDVGHQDVARALSLLRTHDPREARPGVVSSALVSERDIEVLISHGARRWFNATSRVQLERGHATLQTSSPAPANPFGAWLNLELRLEETGGLPVVAGFRVGGLPLPAWLVERVALGLAARAGLAKELQVLADVVRRVRFVPRQMLVTYAWQGDSAGRLLDGLLTAEELQRMRPYADRLAALVAQHSAGSFELPMTALLGPLFEVARQRSAAGADAAAENRAALVVLTLFANGRSVASVAPSARAWPQARRLRLLLAKRPDFALHFLISATLASEGTTPLSKAIGVYKEVADSRGGSGFSFNDIAADRAGTRFGELARQAPLELQQRLTQSQAQGLSDTALMPAWEDLPEYLPEAEFVRRFGGVGAPPYNSLVAEIDRRIGALALLR